MTSRSLSPNEKRCRALALGALPAALLLLRALPPEGMPGAFFFHASCGAITGLPCIFCGTTRALHFLLQGDWARALYFNWLAFPILAAAVALIAVLALELYLGRNLLMRLPRIRWTRTTIARCAAGLLLLWGLQVYLAVSQHKHELLNPAGPLHSLIVR